MSKIKLVMFFLLTVTFLYAQNNVTSPHGQKLKIACETCHTTADWKDVPRYKFNHDQVGFPLVGEHKFAECSSCHKSLVFSRVGIACADCHTDFHKSELGVQCETCHSSQNWENRQIVFDRHNQTNFPLIGVHANLDCESCHTNEQGRQFANLSVECQSCHLVDYMATLSPSHHESGFNLDCQKCHLANATVWERAIFNHPDTFPLKDGHSGLDCADCHSSGIGGTNTDCYSCHRKDYEKTTDPDHLTFGFPTDCQQCHTGVSWARSSFNHVAESGFAIEGAHQSVLCTDCHINNQLSGIPRDCVGCHRKDFNAVTDPNHVTNNFDLNCTACHSSTAWLPANFDHASTDFPLVGAHTSVDCADCHTTGYTQQLPDDCWSCHESNYKTVKDPDHVSNNFDHDCTTCHSSSAWTPATFDHASTDFPLVGAHTSVDCADCHTTGYSQQLPTDCWSCHESNFKAVEDPNHITNNFDHDCTTCHSSSAWTPATFDHASTEFPLTGAHATADCSACHSSGYQNTPLECWSCHESVYNQTTDPNHKGANFPTTCESCHTTKAWTPASWDHDKQYFPIYSGKHKDEWNACADCHINTNNYVQFECITCHEHSNKSELDNDHKDVSGYSYDSQACYTCHPTGDD
jgi:hypothetical protein